MPCDGIASNELLAFKPDGNGVIAKDLFDFLPRSLDGLFATMLLQALLRHAHLREFFSVDQALFRPELFVVVVSALDRINDKLQQSGTGIEEFVTKVFKQMSLELYERPLSGQLHEDIIRPSQDGCENVEEIIKLRLPGYSLPFLLVTTGPNLRLNGNHTGVLLLLLLKDLRSWNIFTSHRNILRIVLISRIVDRFTIGIANLLDRIVI